MKLFLILFKALIFLLDLIFITQDFDFASYGNDDTLESANNMDRGAKFLEETSTKLLKWFSDDLMKSNAGKGHLLVSIDNTVNIRVENFDVRSSHCEKL